MKETRHALCTQHHLIRPTYGRVRRWVDGPQCTSHFICYLSPVVDGVSVRLPLPPLLPAHTRTRWLCTLIGLLPRPARAVPDEPCLFVIALGRSFEADRMSDFAGGGFRLLDRGMLRCSHNSHAIHTPVEFATIILEAIVYQMCEMRQMYKG